MADGIAAVICRLAGWLPYSPLAPILHLQAPPSPVWAMPLPILTGYLVLTFLVRKLLARYLDLD